MDTAAAHHDYIEREVLIADARGYGLNLPSDGRRVQTPFMRDAAKHLLRLALVRLALVAHKFGLPGGN